MIQNIEPHVYRNEYVPEPPKEDSVILYYEGRKILVKLEDQEISFLTFKEAAVCYPDIYEDYQGFIAIGLLIIIYTTSKIMYKKGSVVVEMPEDKAEAKGDAE